MKNTKTTTGLFSVKSDDLDEELNAISLGEDNEWFSAFYFLHGICGFFALALHDYYGYDIWRLDGIDEDVDEGEEPMDFLIHIYCVAPNGQLIDVRGSTTDENAFVEEFLDFCDEDNINGRSMTAEELRNFLKPLLSEKEFDYFYYAAMDMITTHEDWYDCKSR